jgi:glycosyltransferase involved in cell wall biosynthesis
MSAVMSATPGVPRVSVIIPTYNHAHFLREALRSLCDQTFTDWEAIVVNNFSQDDTVAVVEAFADSRIRLENFSNHGVIAASRNHGIALARGTYIAFLDSDDTWYPEKLARCLAHFGDRIGLVCHGLHWFGEQERDVFGGPAERATFDGLLDEGNCITPSATVVSRSLVLAAGGFSENPEIVTSEDYHLWIKLAQAGVKFHFMREVLGQYRVHSGNQSGSVLRHLKSVLCVINEFLPRGDSPGLQQQMRLRRRYGTAYYGAGRGMQRNRNFAEAWPLLLRALRYWPFFPKNYVALALNLFRIAK